MQRSIMAYFICIIEKFLLRMVAMFNRYKHQNATSLPMLVEGALESLRVTQVQCGWKHTMALTVDGDVFAWGWGGSQGTHGVDGLSSGGQLGLGNENDFLEPTQVKSKNMKAIQISCGFNHSGAILEEQ